MKQYIHDPDRDVELEFDVPDNAVYLSVGGMCPTCSGGDRRVNRIDFVKQSYDCSDRAATTGLRHSGLPRIRWSAMRRGDGPYYAHVYEAGSSKPTVVHPRIVPGGERARPR